MNIHVVIEGRTVDPRLLWFSEMSLSSARPRVPPSDFQLSVPQTAFMTALAGPYAKCVAELKEDEALTGDTDSLGEAGYPELDQLLEAPALCAEVLRGYLFTELLWHFLPWGNTGPGSFVIDTFTSVRRDGDRVVISGECLRV